jgi:AraC-like DNA-binding protein/mannose-6-phosphate isomerase-like protein (cupin superfamily)
VCYTKGVPLATDNTVERGGSSMDDLRNLVFDIRYLSLHLPKHTHRAYEIIFVLDGELLYFVEDRTYKLTAGSILCIPANSLHQNVTVDKTKYRAIMIRFSKDFVQTHMDTDDASFFYSCYYKTRALKLNQEQTEEIKELCLNMFNEFNTKDPGYEYYCHALLVQLVIKVKRFSLVASEDSRVDYPNYLHMKISKIAGFINANYTEQITLKNVAEEFGISEYYLSRNFRTVTGFSFSEYVNTTRINMAKKLLRDTNMKITRIAEETGFNTITHFGRMFKSMTGCSPKTFRLRSV